MVFRFRTLVLLKILLKATIKHAANAYQKRVLDRVFPDCSVGVVGNVQHGGHPHVYDARSVCRLVCDVGDYDGGNDGANVCAHNARV